MTATDKKPSDWLDLPPDGSIPKFLRRTPKAEPKRETQELEDMLS